VGELRHDAALIAFDRVDLSLGGRLILTGIDVAIRKGEFLSVVGPSGCGKTSLLNLAAGLLMPSSGRVTYDGKPVTGPRQDIAISRRISARPASPSCSI